MPQRDADTFHTAIQAGVPLCYFKTSSIPRQPCAHKKTDKPHCRPPIEQCRTWGLAQAIDATQIREYLLGKPTQSPTAIDPQGIIIHRARIIGRLDLDNVKSDVPLIFSSCYLPEGITGSNSNLSLLKLENCHIGDLWESDKFASLYFEDAEFRGGIYLQGAIVTNNQGTAIDLSGSVIHNDVLLEKDFQAFGNGEDGTIKLNGSKIGGQLNLEQVVINNKLGPAIVGDRMVVESSVFINGKISASDNMSLGAIRMIGAKIHGQLNISESTIINHNKENGPAIVGDGLHVLDSINIFGKFTIQGGGEYGTLRLPGVTIDGDLYMNGPDDTKLKTKSRIINKSGPAAIINNAQVNANAYFGSNLILTGENDDGALLLKNAKVGGGLKIDSTEFRNNSGPSTVATNIEVNGNLNILGDSEAADGLYDQFTQIDGGTINGDFELSVSFTKPVIKTILRAANLKVEKKCEINLNFRSRRKSESIIINLENAHVLGRLHVSEQSLLPATENGKWSIDGFVYTGTPCISGDQAKDFKTWSNFLANGTSSYATQPFRYFAGQLIAIGHYSEAHEVLIEQRKQRSKLMNDPFRKFVDFLLRTVIGYGYRTWRAFIGLLICLILTSIPIFFYGNGIGLGAQDRAQADPIAISTNLVYESLEQSDKLVLKGLGNCTNPQKFLVAVETAVPLVTTGVKDSCKIVFGTKYGDRLSIILLFFRSASWALAAFFIAGFTTIVRKD